MAPSSPVPHIAATPPSAPPLHNVHPPPGRPVPSAPPGDEESIDSEEFFDMEEYEFYSNMPSRVNSVEDFDIYDEDDGQVGGEVIKSAFVSGGGAANEGRVYPRSGPNSNEGSPTDATADPAELAAAASAARARQRQRQKQAEAQKVKSKLDGSQQGNGRKLQRDPNLPRALYDPRIRKQLARMRQHKAFFVYTVMVLETVILLCALAVNWKLTGLPIQTSPFNLMVGPTMEVIVQFGARYTGCIRAEINANGTGFYCPPTVSGQISGGWCSTQQMQDWCGMTNFYTPNPDQWYRFVTPIFIHGGLVHLGFTLLLHWRTAVSMEQDFGWWRIGLIYMISGVGGYIFGAVFNPTVVATGSTGAIYGLIGCLLLDLVQNWRVIVGPWREAFKLIVTMVLTLAIGLLPYIDNWANVGGFLTGVCVGFIFMPTIHFSKWSKRRKQLLICLAIPLVIVLFVLGLRAFYLRSVSCWWCAYFDCFPQISGFCGISQVPVYN